MLFYYTLRPKLFMAHMHLENLMLIDIETVSQFSVYNDMPERWQQLWADKVKNYLPENDTPESYYPKRAAILAEFGKVICISIGYFKNTAEGYQLRIKSFAGDDEKLILLNFIDAVSQWKSIKKDMSFCGHNIKEFDMPYICRRMLVNGLKIPYYLDFQSMKPWETNITDTMHLWKFGDVKNFISLNLLAACLNVESPKDDIDGSMVGDVYWKENGLQRIIFYCQKDVVTVAQIMLKMYGLESLKEESVIISM